MQEETIRLPVTLDKAGWRKDAPIRATVGDVDSIGKTKAEALANVQRDVLTALSGSHEPIILTVEGYIGIATRTPGGWWATVLGPDQMSGGLTQHHTVTSLSGDGYAELLCRLQLVIAYRMEADGCRLDQCLDALDESEWGDFSEQYVQKEIFNGRYQAARRAGYSDNDCFAYAGNDPSRSAEWFEEVARKIVAQNTIGTFLA